MTGPAPLTTADFSIRKTPPLAELVGRRLREMLAQRVFAPGDRLTEEELARRLNVSRTPVREALVRLAQSGLVEQRDGGFHVPRLELKDVQEIFQIRRLLEPQAVADVALCVTESDLAEFRAACARVVEARTEEQAVAANIAFRNLWLSRIPNQRMCEMLSRFDDQVMLVRQSTLRQPSARQAATTGVVALVYALEARDPEAARTVMTGFIDAALAWFEAAVAPSPPQ
jgi:DNA-binding GntR family transcriptional regulator